MKNSDFIKYTVAAILGAGAVLFTLWVWWERRKKDIFQEVALSPFQKMKAAISDAWGKITLMFN